jgi:hypothetical protein
MIDKFVHSMTEAMAGIADGSTVLLGGFGDVGIPTALLDGLIAQGARDLTIVAVAGGRDGSAIERLRSVAEVEWNPDAVHILTKDELLAAVREPRHRYHYPWRSSGDGSVCLRSCRKPSRSSSLFYLPVRA